MAPPGPQHTSALPERGELLLCVCSKPDPHLTFLLELYFRGRASGLSLYNQSHVHTGTLSDRALSAPHPQTPESRA